jgi:hypothetical protein
MFRHITTRVAGLIILIAGIWGGLIPFLGPTFHFTLGPDVAWHWTTSRLWLSVLPAIAAILGGLILMGRGPRLSGRFGALLALAGGVWFVVGPDVSMLWNHGVSAQGVAHGHHAVTRMLEYLTLHSGLGVLITALAAYSLPGVTTTVVRERHRVERDAAVAGTGAAAGAAAEAHHRDRVAEREAGPVGARTAVNEPAGAREPVNERAGNGAVEEPAAGNGAVEEPAAGNGAVEEPAAGNGAEAEPATAGTQPTTRRRGGLAGLFGRR